MPKPYTEMTVKELWAAYEETKELAASVANNRQRRNDYSDRLSNIRGALLGRGEKVSPWFDGR